MTHIDEMTFAIRSVLVDVGRRARRETSSGIPKQESLRLMDRRLAGVCGADYLFLLIRERVITSKRQIKLHLELIKAHNNPRWRQIEGTEAGTLKSRITQGNPVIAILRRKTKDKVKLTNLNLEAVLLLPPSDSSK